MRVFSKVRPYLSSAIIGTAAFLYVAFLVPDDFSPPKVSEIPWQSIMLASALPAVEARVEPEIVPPKEEPVHVPLSVKKPEPRPEPVETPKPAPTPEPTPEPVVPKPAPMQSIVFSFSDESVVYAANTMVLSDNADFWVSSGGRLEMKGGVGQTMQGVAPTGDRSREQYARVNPLDTDGGKYPQNTFRLVTKKKWGDGEQEVRFRIVAHNLTNTPNRDGYSGIFLMSRYTDQYNLYYAGVRDDGLAVIKKKIKGTYYTLGTVQAYGKAGEYHKTQKPSLLPTGAWISMKSRVVNQADGSVRIVLYLKHEGAWREVLSVIDRNIGGPAFTHEGHGGIRTDYMDAQFDDLTFHPADS